MDEEPQQRDLAGSSATFPTDSENYSSSHNELSPSPPSSSSSPMILYSPPTIWGLLRGAAINLLLPFVNGLMLGFGELLAHEAAFRLGWSGTKFSSSGTIVASPRPGLADHPTVRWRASMEYQQWSPARLDNRITARFASSSANEPIIANVQPEYAPSTTTPAFSEEDFLSTPLDDVTSDFPIPEYDHMGFLKEMGLDYGWGTTSMMETLLELVHINAGTPWWASISLTLVIVRLVLLKGYFGAADMSARNQLIAQYNEPIMERMKAAQLRQDTTAVAKAWKEMSDLRASAGIKYWKLFVPFIQIPIGFGAFRLMRGMSYLPVPGLDTGGPLWMQDLTLSDPYFILPVVTAASYWYTFKAGGESGASNAMMTPTVRRIFLYVLPPFSGIIMCAWPGALQFTFFVQAMISMVQSAALRSNGFRNLVGIQPVPSPSDIKPSASSPYSGTINRAKAAYTAPRAKKGGIEGAIADLKKAVPGFAKSMDEQPKANRRTAAELRHAQAYDARRKREIAQEKFERDQRREEQRQRH